MTVLMHFRPADKRYKDAPTRAYMPVFNGAYIVEVDGACL